MGQVINYISIAEKYLPVMTFLQGKRLRQMKKFQQWYQTECELAAQNQQQ